MSRKYRRVIAAAFGSEWAILPEKLESICELLELRADGVRMTGEQIRGRIGVVEPPQNRQAGTVAVLNLFGTVSQRMNAFSEFSGGTSTEQFAKAFQEAMDNPQVDSIVINVDSPGGTVPGVPELSEQIYNGRQKKRIVAVVNPMMASAAYWIASAASEIVAIPSASDIGSIGVLTMHTDQSGMEDKLGVRHTIISSAEFKAEGNPHQPLSESAREHFNDRVMGIHAEFVAAVARNRGISVERVESQFGQGRTYRAAEALERGMIDRVATLESVLDELSGVADSHSTVAAIPPQSKRETTMLTPKVKVALVKAGLCAAGAEQSAFESALNLFLEAEGKAGQELSESELLGLFNPATPQPIEPKQPAASESGLSAADIISTINLSSLSAEAKNSLTKELVGKSGDLTLSEILERINREEVASNPPNGGVRVQNVASEVEKFEAAARDALLERAWGPADVPTQIYNHRVGEMVDYKPQRRQYGLSSLPKLAEACLIQAGVPYQKVANLAPMHIAQLAMGKDLASLGIYVSSDAPAYNVSGMFSNILLDASNVLLRRSYTEAPASFARWMRQGPSVSDFKTVNKVLAGELGDPKAIPENGEFEETSLTDGKETYKLTVWGSVFSHSWQLIVNDQLGAFTETPIKQGRSMRRKQNRLAYQVLKDNATMGDGGALFNTTAITTAGGHDNIATGALTTVADHVAGLNTMTQQMAEQRGLDTTNGSALNLTPRFVIYPPAKAGIIRQTIGSMSSDTTNPGLVNIWQGALEPIQEAELGAASTGGSDVQWYIAADSADIDTIEYAYLQGLEAPVIEQEMAFNSLAMRQRIYQAFAVSPLDHRGLQRHNGA